jgi:hypothetical protein
LLARSTWIGLLYLFVNLPIGIVSFTLVVTALTVSFGSLTAPLTYTLVEEGIQLGIWTIDTFPRAIVAVPVGVIALGASASILNGAARLSDRIMTIFFEAQ